MDSIIQGIFSVLLYLFICGLIVILVNTNYFNKEKRNNFSLFLTIAIAIVFSFFNKVNSFPELYGSDRLNYKLDYYGRLTNFSGFDLYLKIINHISNGSFEFLLYFTTFLSCLVIFISYSYSKLFSIYALLFFFSSNYVIFTFTGLKQSLAMMFTNVAFLLLLSKKEIKYYRLVCWILIIFACYCHTIGYLMIPIYFLLTIDFSRGKKYLFLAIILVLSILFMKQLLLAFASISQAFVPTLSNKLIEYLGEDTLHITDGKLSALKGIPYYVISYYLLKNKKRYSVVIPNFNSLFVLGLMAAVTSLSTIVSYWFSRATLMLVFPVSLLFGQMILNAESRRERQILLVSVIVPMILFTLRSIVLTYINYGGY